MFRGSFPALVTPFKNGEIDKKALESLVEWHIDSGSHGLVPVGTTGESPTLTHEEDRIVIKTVIEISAGRIPIIAGAGSNNTAEAIEMIKFAGEVQADGALVVTPYYNRPNAAGIRAHYEALNNVAKLPIIIYNIPLRSAIDISPELMGELSKLSNIIGVKDATASLDRVPLQRLYCGKDFIQLSGEDATAVGFNAMGGSGCISVTANVAPALCAKMQEASLAGNFEKALEIQDLLMPLHEAIFTEPGLVGAKTGLEILGKCTSEVRLPLVSVSADTRKKITKAMEFAGLI